MGRARMSNRGAGIIMEALNSMLAINPANIIGAIALIMTAVALTRRSNHGLLGVLGVAVLLWALHYGLLGSLSGAAIHLVAAASLFTAHFMQSARSAFRFFTGIAFAGAGVFSSWHFGSGLADVLAAIGCVILTMTQFMGRGNTLRIGFIAGETLLFGFAFLIGSLPGMLVTVSNFIAGLVGLVRRYRETPLVTATQ